VWLGADDLLNERVWRWRDGSELAVPPFVAWENQASPLASDDCVAISTELTSPRENWIGASCAELHPYVCDVFEDVNAPGCTNIFDANVPIFHVHCPTPVSFDEAAAQCAQLGGTLAVARTLETNDLIRAVSLDVDPAADLWWIGGNDRDFEGLWTWLDGTLIDRFE
jgi:hypothetical protein